MRRILSRRLREAIEDPDKFVKEGKAVVQLPFYQSCLLECFDQLIGTGSGKVLLPAALHRLGFDRVFDTNFRLPTIAMSLLRVKGAELLPMISYLFLLISSAGTTTQN